VPLIARGERIGLLQLGPRRNGEAYEAMDFEALVEVSGEVARAMDHALREGGPTAPIAGEPTTHHAT
jgi:hypothetical protein